MVQHVYLSPHLDDAAISCGGLLARQTAAGEAVTVVTICAGDPPDGPLSDFARVLHSVWQVESSPIGARREEDIAACRRLGAVHFHLDIPDAIYRLDETDQPFYPTLTEVFGPLHPAERDFPADLARRLQPLCPEGAQIYAPIGYGGHVDHRLVRLAAQDLGRPLLFYRDMPYGFRDDILPRDLPLPDGRRHVFTLSADEIDAWHAAVLEHRSQLSSFWESDEHVRRELQAYHEAHAGLVLVESM